MRDDDALLSVNEAAQALGLSVARLRALAAAGALPAEFVGGRWVFRSSALPAGERRPLRGRPLSARIAWAVLAALDGRPPPFSLHREERARVERYRARPFEELAPRLRARAGLRRLSVGPKLRERLREHPSWVDAGQLRGGGVGGGGQMIDVVYTPDHALEALVEDVAGLDDPWGSLVVRAVPARAWPFTSDRGTGAWPVLQPFDVYDVFGSLPASRDREA